MMCPWDISRGFRGFLLLAVAFWTTALVLADVRGLTETLRKYPPLPFLNRECTKDYTFPNSDITVRQGDAVVISPYGLQRDADIYPDPERFDPDRFAEDRAKVNPYTYLPFGEGPRICIGYRFGLMQAKFTIALILKHFRFTLNNKTKLPFELSKNSFTLSVDGGIWLNAEKI